MKTQRTFVAGLALIPEQMPAPGFFMADMGATTVIFDFVMHMLYGAIVGAVYGRIAPAST